MFISGNKCTILVGAVDDGEAARVREQGAYGKPLYLLLNFALSLKLLKNKAYSFLKSPSSPSPQGTLSPL